MPSLATGQGGMPAGDSAKRSLAPSIGAVPEIRGPVPPGITDLARPPSFHQRGDRDSVEDSALVNPVALVVTIGGGAVSDPLWVGQSLVRQSLQAWRWVIAAPPEVVARIQDDRVLVLDEGGPTETIERIVSLIRTIDAPFVAFVDHRDTLDPTTLERWAWCLESTAAVSWVRSRSTSSLGGTAADHVSVQTGLDFVADPDRSTSFMIRRRELLAAGGLSPAEPLDSVIEEAWLRLATLGSWGSELVSADLTTAPWPDDKREQVRSTRAQVALRFGQAVDPESWHTLVRPQGVYTHPARLPEDAARPNPVFTRERRFLVVLPYIAAGGSEKVILDTVALLTSRSWHATVVVTGFGDDDWGPRFRAHTDDILQLGQFLPPNTIDPSMWSQFPRFMRYLVESRDPEVILISNSTIGFGCVPWLREAAPNVTMLGIHHAAYWPPLAAEFAHMLDGVLVSFRALADQFVANGVPADRVHHFYTGVDTTTWHPDAIAKAEVRLEVGTPSETAVLLFVGRWSPDKRPWLVIDIAVALQERGHKVEAWIVGDGPERDRVRTAARSAGDRVTVRILGPIADEQLTRVMPAADLMVLPSEHEGIAVTAFEALACGIPFIGADIGGQRELVTPDCGVLIRPSLLEREVSDYVDAIDSLLADPERLRRMGETGRRLVSDNFSVEDMADRLESVIDAASGAAVAADALHGPRLVRFAASLAVTHHYYERQDASLIDARDFYREQCARLEDALDAELAAGLEIASARDWHAAQSALWEAQAVRANASRRRRWFARVRRSLW